MTANILTPNTLELDSICEAIRESSVGHHLDWFATLDSFGVDASVRSKLDHILPKWTFAEGVAQKALMLLPAAHLVLVKAGERGVFVAMRTFRSPISDTRVPLDWALTPGGVALGLVPAPSSATLVSSTGAGDTLCGALVAALSKGVSLGQPVEVAELVAWAQDAAAATLASKEAVGDLKGLVPRLQELIRP